MNPKSRVDRPLAVDVRSERRGVPPNVPAFLRREITRLAAMLGITGGELAIVIVGDKRMAELHLAHTGVAGTTDVLTFDLVPASPKSRRRSQARRVTIRRRRIDADLVLCWDVAAREAKARGHAVRMELLLYALHGMLHLVGYDDHAPADAAAMHRREDAVLRRAGLPAVYRT